MNIGSGNNARDMRRETTMDTSNNKLKKEMPREKEIVCSITESTRMNENAFK